MKATLVDLCASPVRLYLRQVERLARGEHDPLHDPSDITGMVSRSVVPLSAAARGLATERLLRMRAAGKAA